ncbi:mitochondrial basic amino acids transporter [Homalodisca vitripennis]|uniref:mitochondrial basic amino acids transporter n=1 Tax=Homalodisca vitripennis TaxID=197043 RepID=UPI001EECE6F8|nr:mitochondrial basic amino acids transporter [Homalodisca vitripennis]
MALDFFAGCVGGCAGVIIGHPFDTVKVKLQTQDYRNPVYRGTWDCFTKILKAESVAGIYRGVSSPMAGVALVNAIVFGVYGNVQRQMANPEALQSIFLAGASSGLLQSVISSPVELVKTRVQISNQYRGTLDCFMKTYKQEGFRGVFKGQSITGVRDFLGYGLYFASYEVLTRRRPGEAPVGTPTMLMAGGVAGTVSWIFTYPLDVVKSRYQADIGKYTSIVDCLIKSVKGEGMMCLTRGLTPTLIRAFPTNAVTFTVVTWIFRLADLGTWRTENLKDSIDSIIETLPNEQRIMKNLDIIEGSSFVNNVRVGRLIMSEPQKHFLASEDLWVGDGSDLSDDVTSDDLFKPSKGPEECDNVLNSENSDDPSNVKQKITDNCEINKVIVENSDDNISDPR